MDKLTTHRVLFCIGINQNFMDSTKDVMGDVWQAFSAMMKGIADLPGLEVLGIMDDDRIMVGPSATAPWTAYIMADVPDIETVIAGCDLFRSTPVGDGTYTLWKYAKVEARVGRQLVVPS